MRPRGRVRTTAQGGPAPEAEVGSAEAATSRVAKVSTGGNTVSCVPHMVSSRGDPSLAPELAARPRIAERLSQKHKDGVTCGAAFAGEPGTERQVFEALPRRNPPAAVARSDRGDGRLSRVTPTGRCVVPKKHVGERVWWL